MEIGIGTSALSIGTAFFLLWKLGWVTSLAFALRAQVDGAVCMRCSFTLACRMFNSTCTLTRQDAP
jgi:hypothetical protein